MSLIVTGSSGLVGHTVALEALAAGWTVRAQVGRRRIDLPGAEIVTADLVGADDFGTLLEGVTAVVHTAAISEPGAVDADPEGAARVNVELPGRLAAACAERGIRLVHLSTDMVFDGTAAPYRQDDPVSPLGHYGDQKRAAEAAVRQVFPAAAILRLPIVSGNSPGGARSAHEKLLQILVRGERPTLFVDEWRTPVSAWSAARAALALASRPDLTGTFHWACTDRVSRSEMAQTYLNRFGLPGDLIDEASVADHPGRPTDLSLDLRDAPALLGLEPEGFDAHIDKLEIPAACREWVATHTNGGKATGTS